MKLNKENTIEELVTYFEQLGYYLPKDRVRNFIKHSTYTAVVKKLRELGVPNARDYFTNKIRALKDEEQTVYKMAAMYGEV